MSDFKMLRFKISPSTAATAEDLKIILRNKMW